MKYFGIFFSVYFTYSLGIENLGGYITGGSIALYSQYPHAVHLYFGCHQRYICGGSILNQVLLLTAAHCFELCLELSNVTVVVRYGHEDVLEMNKTKMRSFMIHEFYNETTVMNDIALVSTKERIPLNDEVKRVIVMKSPPYTSVGYVAGWGRNENNASRHLLKHVEAVIQPNEVCEDIFGLMPVGTFCAGPITGFGAAAQGDSGCALVTDECIQIGVVSFNTERYSLVAYTNVSYYFDWITETSKHLYCEKNSRLEEPIDEQLSGTTLANFEYL